MSPLREHLGIRNERASGSIERGNCGKGVNLAVVDIEVIPKFY